MMQGASTNHAMSHMKIQKFRDIELGAVHRARATAEKLVGSFYVLAPHEWERIHYEVRTLDELAPEEICDQAFAQVLCYDCTKRAGTTILFQRDLYRICVQDHRILPALTRFSGTVPLDPFLLYVLTHELVHVVRFAQRMQEPDLDPALRPQEELNVEQMTRQILLPVADRQLQQVVQAFARVC